MCLCAEVSSFKRGVDSVCEVDDPTIVYIIKVTMGGRREKESNGGSQICVRLNHGYKSQRLFEFEFHCVTSELFTSQRHSIGSNIAAVIDHQSSYHTLVMQ